MYSAEIISLLLVHALKEDTRVGGAKLFVPCALSSLIALQIALREYSDVLRMNAGYTSKRGSNSNNSVTLSRGVGEGKSQITGTMSIELLGISAAVEDAINRIIVGYSDIIPSYSFPSIYAAEIQNRMR
jgi:hypothetical protein